MTGKHQKILMFLVVALPVTLFFVFDLQRYLTLAELKLQQETFEQFYAGNRGMTLGIYFVIYIVFTALSVPGAILMSLAGGALFGFLPALIVVSFASSIGATLAFLTSRFLLRNWVQERFRTRLAALHAGIEKEGEFYLFTLRLLPLVPFFVVNLVMGLTPMRTRTYYWVSQLGMLPGTAVHVNAGTQLGQVENLGGLLSPGLIFSFVLLGIFPLIARKGIDLIHKHRSRKVFFNPDKCD